MSHQPTRIRELLDRLDERLNWASTGNARHVRIAQSIAAQLRHELGLPPDKHSR